MVIVWILIMQNWYNLILFYALYQEKDILISIIDILNIIIK